MRTESTVERRSFTFRRCLGRGGFGEVYLATMTSSGGVKSDVAVKVLVADVDVRSQAVQRLRDEGKLLGTLNHPSILRVHDIVLLDHRVALVTEFVDGADLSQILKGRDEKLPVRALIEIIGRVADALHAAWTSPSPEGGELKLVHRDIKPQNIRIGRHGDVKLLDFGIARANDNVVREAQTQTNVVVGSFGYIAPERMFSTGAILPAGDMFALGCVLYQALTREQFFHRTEEKRMYQLALDPDEYGVFVHKRLDKAKEHGEITAMLAGMLAFDPENRPTAREVATSCERLAEELQGAQLKRWCRERQWPETDPFEGVLDGKVITEATLARTADRRPAEPPPELQGQGTSRTKAGLLVGGGMAMLATGGGAALVLALVVLLVGYYALSPGPVVAEPVIEPVPVVEDTPKPAKRPIVVAPKIEVKTAPALDANTPAKVAPKPTPKPVAPSGNGTVKVEGGVAIQLWANGESYAPGELAKGRYEVRVDYGTGLLEPLETIDVGVGKTVLIKCSKLRQTCAVVYP